MINTAAVTVLFCSFGTLMAAEPKGDLKTLQGTWVLHAADLAGRDHLEYFEGMKLTVNDERYEIDFGDNSDKGTIKLDESKNPRQIDLTTLKDGPFKGRDLPGIYEFKGDTVVLCLNSEKPDRPTKFEAPEKSPLMLLTFKRAKK